MAKKAAASVVVLYLLGVTGVTISALSINWSPNWSFREQLHEAAGVGISWLISVVELFTQD